MYIIIIIIIIILCVYILFVCVILWELILWGGCSYKNDHTNPSENNNPPLWTSLAMAGTKQSQHGSVAIYWRQHARVWCCHADTAHTALGIGWKKAK